MSENVVIECLNCSSVHQVSKFHLRGDDNKSLVRFIRRDALKSAGANLTRTYIAKFEGKTKVLAYISIMCAEVPLETSYSISEKVGADRYKTQPAIRIARLAVDQGAQKMGLGKLLVQFVMGIVQVSIQPNVGCRFVVLDAKQQSVSFYKKLGFRLLDTDTNKAKPAPVMFMDIQKLA